MRPLSILASIALLAAGRPGLRGAVPPAAGRAPVAVLTAFEADEGRRSPAQVGRPVASVGREIIGLPEMTTAVQDRLAEVPPEQALDRRGTVALAKAVYKVTIVRSLVFQEARDVLGGPAPLAAMVRGLERRWADRELPELIRREGAGSLVGLRTKLARRPTTPGLLREEFVVRSVAEALRSRDPAAGDLASYLEGVRRRRPIVQIMSESELSDAGRDAALAARRRR